MELKRNGSQPSGLGPDEYFTGMVRIDPLFLAPDPARVLGVSVTFEPGARTAWHTHPLGQTLIERMRVPCCPGTGLERNTDAQNARRIGCQEQWVNAYHAGKILVR